jgi:uncharacterized protein (TIGR02217 family)
MAFINQRMSRCVAAGFVVADVWQTLIVKLANGREQRNAQHLFPEWRARANYAAFTAEDRLELRSMFLACRGQLHVFRFRDESDGAESYTATNQPLLTVGGVTYLAKAYTFGSETAYRLIQAPVTATLSGAGSVDMNTGVVTGSSPGDTWSGTFDVWVRFDSDENQITAETQSFHRTDIGLVEVRR